MSGVFPHGIVTSYFIGLKDTCEELHGDTGAWPTHHWPNLLLTQLGFTVNYSNWLIFIILIRCTSGPLEIPESLQSTPVSHPP
jgi:hypothetical protein